MSIGVVVIGRNEGERLRRCLESVVGITQDVVYVDSGSSDGSVELAIKMGLGVVELDLHIPFTAARARNEGSKLLQKIAPNLDFIQFVDGDCELKAGWLEFSAAYLESNRNVAVVCGRLRERFPDKSIYNKLCEIEWDTAIGQTKACGGIAMMNISAFKAAAGFREDLIAGEESELCIRFRGLGWQIWRLDADMALHDAEMTHFSQWWKRSIRGGYAYAEGRQLHGTSPERHRVKESQRIWFWGLGVPVFTFSLAMWLGTWSLVLLLIYPVQVIRLASRGSRTLEENWLQALFLVLGKFPEVIGQLNYFYNKIIGKTAQLIEYK